MKATFALSVILLLGADKPPEAVTDFSLLDAKGKKYTSCAWEDHKAIVLIFLGTECPVSNGYAPEYRRLAESYSSKGVRFYGIHPDPDVTAAIAAKHAAEYRVTFPVLLDPSQKVTNQAGATVVPSAVVLTPSGQVLYRGRIDDLYTLDGKRREEPKTRDLDDAIQAVLAGKRPSVSETKAFGCPLPPPLKPKE